MNKEDINNAIDKYICDKIENKKYSIEDLLTTYHYEIENINWISGGLRQPEEDRARDEFIEALKELLVNDKEN
jgi:nicotinamide riboside kinase